MSLQAAYHANIRALVKKDFPQLEGKERYVQEFILKEVVKQEHAGSGSELPLGCRSSLTYAVYADDEQAIQDNSVKRASS